MDPDDFRGQVRQVIDQAGNRALALLADLYSCQFDHDRGNYLFKVDLESGVCGCFLA